MIIYIKKIAVIMLTYLSLMDYTYKLKGAEKVSKPVLLCSAALTTHIAVCIAIHPLM